MKFEIITTKSPQASGIDLSLVSCFEDARALPKGFPDNLMRQAELEGFEGKLGQSFAMHTQLKGGPRLTGVVGLGPKGDITVDTLRQLGGYCFKLADARRSKTVMLHLPKVKIEESQALQAVAEGALLAGYRFNKYLTEDPPNSYLEKLYVTSEVTASEAKATIQRATDIASGVCLARDLINEGPLVVNPEALASLALREGRKLGLDVDVLDEKALAKEKMNLMLAVAQASSSAAPPRLVRMAYRPKKAKKHIMLVGKGVTFDTGGLNMKSTPGMWDMKADMSGAASVIGTMFTIAKLKPDVAVTGYMACVENGVSGNSYHPGDVIKSRKGLTVEINNTDAEGRLVLADALNYGQSKDKPDVVIDIATLTGAIIVALGNTTAGLFANDDKLADQLVKSGTKAGEAFWRMPISEDLSYQLKSPIADMRQTGDKPRGGAIVAALFLKKYIEEGVHWAHLDIGPAMTEKEHPYNVLGGTGFAVRTLVNFLCD